MSFGKSIKKRTEQLAFVLKAFRNTYDYLKYIYEPNHHYSNFALMIVYTIASDSHSFNSAREKLDELESLIETHFERLKENKKAIGGRLQNYHDLQRLQMYEYTKRNIKDD